MKLIQKVVKIANVAPLFQVTKGALTDTDNTKKKQEGNNKEGNNNSISS